MQANGVTKNRIRPEGRGVNFNRKKKPAYTKKRHHEELTPGSTDTQIAIRAGPTNH